jgi:catechol 2,3-dioxygenase-like lactoylglutathione lyase family enzyme
MTHEGIDRVHHVVWCVEGEDLERVRAYWAGALGLRMIDIELPERGLHVLLAWDAGIEIIAPTSAGGGADAVRAVLADRGAGVYSVVYRVASIDAVRARLEDQGAELVFEETVPPDVVRQRGIVTADQPSFTIRQAQFRDALGLGVCLQELIEEATVPSGA